MLTTDDGSTTLHIAEWNEQYHSKHGAINEAIHVFINAGLHNWLLKNKAPSISILEIGFGTGLNALLSLLDTKKNNIKVNYTSIEAYPLEEKEIALLNYASELGISTELFLKLHKTPWESKEQITSNFNLHKQKKFFSEIDDIGLYDLIYFDAFGIRVQPELWTEDIFNRMFNALKPNGILVTYAANGNARRAMKTVGFEVEKIPGPVGKREMLRAIKF